MSEAGNTTCILCGEPLHPAEEMFMIHGFSGPCPKPPNPPKTLGLVERLRAKAEEWDGYRRSALWQLHREAADTIETLQRERDEWKETAVAAERRRTVDYHRADTLAAELARAREVLEPTWKLLQEVHWAVQKLGLEGKGNSGLAHEVRTLALHFSPPETPKTPQHTILSGDGYARALMSQIAALAPEQAEQPATRDCPRCENTGDALCPRCNGTGEVPATRVEEEAL